LWTLTEDQHPVEDLAAQGADEALAGRVHARRLDGADQDPGAGGLEDGIERGGEVRATVAEQNLPRSRSRNLMSSNRRSRVRARLRACCTVHSPVGFEVTPPTCIRRVPCSMNTRTYSRLSSTVSACKKSAARIPAAWARRNCRAQAAR